MPTIDSTDLDKLFSETWWLDNLKSSTVLDSKFTTSMTGSHDRVDALEHSETTNLFRDWGIVEDGYFHYEAESGTDYLTETGKDISSVEISTEMAMASRAANVIIGTGASETLEGTNWVDSIHGNGGNDVIYGHGGADSLHGGIGDDEIHGGGDNDHIYGGDGSDVLYGGWGDDWISGGIGRDYIFGGDGSDVLRGEEDNDAFLVANDYGFDSFYGGSGIDEIFVFDPGAVYSSYVINIANLDSIEAIWGSDRGLHTKIVVESIMDFSNVHLMNISEIAGTSANNIIAGSQARDVIKGNGGDDVLQGGGGDDDLYGGAGSDRFIYTKDNAFNKIMDFQDGIDKIDARYDTYTSIGLGTTDQGDARVVFFEGTTPVSVFDLIGVSPSAITMADFLELA